MFTLQFDISAVPYWCARYKYPRQETALAKLVPTVRAAGGFGRRTLQLIADWKSPRSAGHVAGNSDPFIREITSFAFSAKDERSRIEPLTLLDGVSWPTASVILHLFHPEPYPILDFRALWSLGSAPPQQYSFDFWSEYVQYCRTLYAAAGCDQRTFDRAVWQYSKERQKVPVA